MYHRHQHTKVLQMGIGSSYISSDSVAINSFLENNNIKPDSFSSTPLKLQKIATIEKLSGRSDTLIVKHFSI